MRLSWPFFYIWILGQGKKGIQIVGTALKFPQQGQVYVAPPKAGNRKLEV